MAAEHNGLGTVVSSPLLPQIPRNSHTHTHTHTLDMVDVQLSEGVNTIDHTTLA